MSLQNLRANQITQKGAKQLALALKPTEKGGPTASNAHLKELDLFDNRIADIGGKALAEMLKKNKSLVSLHIGSNQLGDNSAKLLGCALTTNEHLTELNMRANGLTSRGVAALAEGLRENSSLKSLNIRWNEAEVRRRQRRNSPRARGLADQWLRSLLRIFALASCRTRERLSWRRCCE